MKLTPRTTRPEAGNKYYIRRESDGWSWACEGKCKSTAKPDPDCDTLANCVGYASGRFNEEADYGKIKYNIVCDAENFISRAKHFELETGSEPRIGAIMVWKYKDTTKHGHVEVVEQKFSDGTLLCSSSGYNAYTFNTYTRSNADGNWNTGCAWMKNNYIYLGCIYNPDIEDIITE